MAETLYIMPSGKFPMNASGEPTDITRAMFESCCCGCASSTPDLYSQPDVSVAEDGCGCPSGSFDGGYSYSDESGGIFTWTGTSLCDLDCDEGDSYSDVTIALKCENTYWYLEAEATGCEAEDFLDGSVAESSIHVNASNKFEGTEAVNMYDANENLICTWTITFGS